MPQMPSELLMRLSLDIDLQNVVNIGDTPAGKRRIVPISGGSFAGDRLAGKVLPGGADWLLYPPAGDMLIDVRIVLETDDKTLIYMNYQGRLEASEESFMRMARGEELATEDYSLVTRVQFESGAEQYHWLNKAVAIGYGSQQGFSPVYEIYLVR